jgi:hypothetical protein
LHRPTAMPSGSIRALRENLLWGGLRDDRGPT